MLTGYPPVCDRFREPINSREIPDCQLRSNQGWGEAECGVRLGVLILRNHMAPGDTTAA